MIFTKKQKDSVLTAEEKEMLARITVVYRKLFPWTLLNIIPGILIGYFTWFYYFYVILGDHIFWNKEGFENVLGFFLLYIAPLFSILGLVSISVTVIARLSYRPIIARHYYEERKVNDKLWNSSVIVSIVAALVTLVTRCLI